METMEMDTGGVDRQREPPMRGHLEEEGGSPPNGSVCFIRKSSRRGRGGDPLPSSMGYPHAPRRQGGGVPRTNSVHPLHTTCIRGRRTPPEYQKGG